MTYQEMLDLVCQASAMQWFTLASISLAARLCGSRLHFGAARTARHAEAGAPGWAPGSKCTAPLAVESKQGEALDSLAAVPQVSACQLGVPHPGTAGPVLPHPQCLDIPISLFSAPLPIVWPCRLATTCAARGWDRTMRWRSTCL